MFWATNLGFCFTNPLMTPRSPKLDPQSHLTPLQGLQAQEEREEEARRERERLRKERDAERKEKLAEVHASVISQAEKKASESGMHPLIIID